MTISTFTFSIEINGTQGGPIKIYFIKSQFTCSKANISYQIGIYFIYEWIKPGFSTDNGGRCHIETSPLTCRAKTVVSMITAAVMKELK